MARIAVARKLNLAAATAAAILAGFAPVSAEQVCVKYREPSCIQIDSFDCESVTRSSFINGVCYRPDLRYMVIQLRATYYHYCEIGADVVADLLAAESMGSFYNQNIKGRFDCRVNAVPEL